MAFNIDLNSVLLGFIMLLISIIGWFFNKRWDSLDKSHVDLVSELKEHNRQSESTHERLWKAATDNVQRIARLEGRQK